MFKRLVRILGNQRGEVTVTDPPAADPPAGDPPAADPPASDPPAADPPAGDPPAADPVKGLTTALSAERKKRQEASQEAAYWRGVAEAGGKAPAAHSPAATPPAPAAPTVPKAPVRVKIDRSKFDDWEEGEAAQEAEDDKYQEARDKYVIEKAKYDLRAEQQEQTVQQTVQQKRSEYVKRLEKASELDPELADIANKWHLPGEYHLPLNAATQELVLESEVGPELLRHLFNNKKDATRIAQLAPVAAMRELVKIESAITAANNTPVKKVSGAPPPVTPASQQRGALDTDDDKRPAADVIREMREASYRRG
jgi:hypothetical protein